VTLLIQSAGADGEQAGEDGQIRAQVGALAGRDAFTHSQRDTGETECESDPLKRTDHLAEQGAPEERSDDRHGADHKRDQPNVDTLCGGPVQRSKLKSKLQRANQCAVQRRAPSWPGDSAEPGERGKNQPRATEAQHQQRERAAVIERDPRRRIT